KSGNNYVFTPTNPQKNYILTNGSVDISYGYTDPSGGTIIKSYRFFADKYEYDLKIEINNPNAMGIDKKYALEWNNKLAPTELNIEDDYNSMWAMAMMTDVRVKFDDYDNNKFAISQDGQTNWIASRSKYFASMLIPRSGDATGAKASGLKNNVNINGKSLTSRELAIGLIMDPSFGETIVDSFTVFAGPLDYDILKNYSNNVVDLLDIGTTPYVGWIIGIFAKPILYLLPAMYNIIPNYGFVIIIFAFLVKLVTWPLSRKSVQSMAAMKEIQPKMTELKEKHKNNPQALNKEMMKLYKEHGVNPISGCLPMLPQMPLFFAMFSVFRSTILLRQAPFMLWWDDLSRGALTFTDPYMILVVLMVILMFVQQKMAMTDPKNKALTYIFPLMLGFFFYNASAGLVLYWMMFSLFSWIEQLMFNKSKKNPEIKTA
ncbi:MAG: membrane protein insertase YidC, partial [Candidatus Zixiibacteriota bacterium]